MDGAALPLIVLLLILAVLVIRNRQQVALLHTALLKQNTLQRTLTTTQTMLDATQKQVTSLANVAFDALIMIDKQRHVTLINDAASALFGGAVAGPTLIAVTRYHQLDTLAEKAFQVPDTLEDQLEMDGRSFRVRAARIDSESVALALQDITELRRLTRARRDMVANISHELRTPISSIRLLVDTLNQNIGRNPDRDTRLLGKIATETDSLQYLTQELHDLSMIESGKAIMRMVEIPFNTIAHNAIERMTAQIEKKKIALTNTIPEEVRVLADPDQTRRVLTNLISNSVKFTPSGGNITFSALASESMITIRVADNGAGIPLQERTRIFERFYQVDSARSSGPQGGGSGLGLSIAKHIVEAHGGQIWAEAAEPHGTCICFTLPQAT